MSDRPTFSPLWHRVRALKPRLRPHVQVTRQHYRGRRWHVAHDPSSNQFYRLNPIAHEFVALLDGRRTIEEVWRDTLTRHGDDAPTQTEAVELIHQLYNANLLSLDTSPETEQLLRRGRERRKKKIQSQAIGIMYFRMRLFNPEPIFTAIEPVLRPLINRWGFVLWLGLIVSALWALIQSGWADLTDPDTFATAIAPANWPWLIVVFIVAKAIHETGHGVILKRFGGHVPEFGMMLLVLFPAPYVDASSAWALPSKWQRIAVGAGGMIFELAIAAVAAHIWLATRSSAGIVHQLAYNTMLTASITTVLFNANPLMRFDGYYILSDLLEMPNLMQRSMNLIKYHFQKYFYRIENARPPTDIRSEQGILLVYGWLALAYRVFLFFSITLFVMGQAFALGLVLAIWTAAAWFLIPLGKWTHWLASSPQLGDKRRRAVALSVVAILIGGLALGAVPAPDHRRASGVIESLAQSGVFVATPGFVDTVHVEPGARVQAGDPIVTLSSPQLEAQIASVVHRLEEFRTSERRLLANQPQSAHLAWEQYEAYQQQYQYLLEREEKLVIRAPQDGVIAAGDPTRLIGAFIEEGQAICQVVDPDRIRVAAVVPQTQADWAPRLNSAPDSIDVQIRMVGHPAVTHSARRAVAREAGERLLPHAALGFAGGGQIATDAEDEQGRVAAKRHFIVEIDPEFDAQRMAEGVGRPWRPLPGERVKVRFSLPPRPLAWQWADSLRKLVQGRVDL